MNAAAELSGLVEQPFELLAELERRSRAAVAGQAAGPLSEEWVGIGFRVGDEQFVAHRGEVREVLMLPDVMTRVPGATALASRHREPAWSFAATRRPEAAAGQRPHFVAAYDARDLCESP